MQAEAQGIVQSGRWTGEYLDVNGFRGRITLDLDATDEGFDGEFRLEIRSEDAAQVLSGRLTGAVGKGEARLIWQPERGQVAEPVTTRAEVRPAGSYARQAMLGVADPVPASNFGGGVWIAWRFADQPGR
jgi:hypothetical protein